MASTNPNKERKRISLNPLELTSPTLFRCPISLEVMRSPVSLSTGITYDRSSIQQWLDSGHITCPATCQPLSSTDLVPNLTLRRLIHVWSGTPPPPPPPPLDQESRSPASDNNSEMGIISTIDTVALHLLNESDLARSESAVGYLTATKKEEKDRVIFVLAENLERSMQALVKVLKNSTEIESRVRAARLIESILAMASPTCTVSDSKVEIIKKIDLFTDLIHLIRVGSLSAVSAGLDCMQAAIASTEKHKLQLEMVKAGVVPVLVTIIKATEAPHEVVGKAIRLLEQAVRCKEGFEEIIEDAKGIIDALVPRMMKVGRGGRDAAVGILWVMCNKGARDAVKVAQGGLVGRLLVVMQEDCSPVVVKMAGDVLRVCTLERDKEGRLNGNYTKTLNTMPF